MNESSWKRLYDIAEARRSVLGLTRAQFQSLGGPSSEWMRALGAREGAPSPRMRSSISDLDAPLGWDDGTAWDLVTKDRSGWSQELLDDEWESLVEGPSLSPAENDLRAFGTLMLAKLRAMSPNEYVQAREQIARIVGIE